jgi:hypothetical protein
MKEPKRVSARETARLNTDFGGVKTIKDTAGDKLVKFHSIRVENFDAMLFHSPLPKVLSIFESWPCHVQEGKVMLELT